MMGEPSRLDRLQARLDLMRQTVRELEDQIEQERNPGARHKRPKLVVLKGGKLGAVAAVPLLWVRDHAAQTAAAAILVGIPSATGGFMAGSAVAPADAEQTHEEPQASSVVPYQNGTLQPPGETGAAPSVSPSPQVTQTSGPTLLLELEATSAAQTPLLGESPLPDLDQAGLGPLTPLPTVTIEPTPTVTASPEPSPSPIPEPSPIEEVQRGRSTIVLECVGEPGDEPPTDVVACVDALLAGVS